MLYSEVMGQLVKKKKKHKSGCFIHSCLLKRVTFLLLSEKEAKCLKLIQWDIHIDFPKSLKHLNICLNQWITKMNFSNSTLFFLCYMMISFFFMFHIICSPKQLLLVSIAEYLLIPFVSRADCDLEIPSQIKRFRCMDYKGCIALYCLASVYSPVLSDVSLKLGVEKNCWCLCWNCLGWCCILFVVVHAR